MEFVGDGYASRLLLCHVRRSGAQCAPRTCPGVRYRFQCTLLLVNTPQEKRVYFFARKYWYGGVLEQGIIMDVAREAMMTVLYLALPLLGISLIVGLAISVFQATTSIQEQTLTFIPKLLAILISLAVFGAWMGNVVTEFTAGLYSRVLEIIR